MTYPFRKLFVEALINIVSLYNATNKILTKCFRRNIGWIPKVKMFSSMVSFLIVLSNLILNIFVQDFLLFQLRGSIIKGGGDIVVGQEYTDFDKGLEDGIEGAIYGFNFVLASTSYNDKNNDQNYPIDRLKRKHSFYDVPTPTKYGVLVIPKSSGSQKPTKLNRQEEFGGKKFLIRRYRIPRRELSQLAPSRLASTKFQPNLLSEEDYRVKRPERLLPDNDEEEGPLIPKVSTYHLFDTLKPVNSFDSVANIYTQKSKPLGLLLVELSFDCSFRKGAPLENSKVLVNWAKTPVRVFGGAILKSIPPFC